MKKNGDCQKYWKESCGHNRAGLNEHSKKNENSGKMRRHLKKKKKREKELDLIYKIMIILKTICKKILIKQQNLKYTD